jgi:hypothetical protein
MTNLVKGNLFPLDLGVEVGLFDTQILRKLVYVQYLFQEILQR